LLLVVQVRPLPQLLIAVHAVQVMPLPRNPGLQAQVKAPDVLVQTALLLQVCDPFEHSLMSAQPLLPDPVPV
jgi:hypothetical protein